MDNVGLTRFSRRNDRAPLTGQSPAAAPPVPEAAAPEAPLVIAAAPEAQLVINALGRKCPIPIILLAKQIGDVPIGSVIAVLADDPAAFTDIPAWASLKSHQLAFRRDYETGWSFGIRRSY
jgi:tRNA 2-thiouridine synthesizing protein A